MKNEIKFNVNDFVKVKLTEYGINVLKEEHKELNDLLKGFLGDFKLELDKEGYYKVQLHELMYAFGKCMLMGTKLPFETNIILIKEDSNENSI